MSFILDALRKSETERRKAQGPGIGDAPLVVHQKHVPRWTVGLIAGLSVGLVVVGWFWLRDADTGTDRDPVGVAASSAPTGPGGAASTAEAFAGADFPTAPPASIAPAIAPDSRPAGEVSDLSAEALLATAAPDAAGVRSAPTSQAAAPSPQAVSTAATPPPRAATTAAPEALAAPMLTLAQYRASGGALPELNLELHVYSPAAAERFVFINSSKYVEGQTLAEGPRLGAITVDGAVLVHQGRSLLLPRE